MTPPLAHKATPLLHWAPPLTCPTPPPATPGPAPSYPAAWPRPFLQSLLTSPHPQAAELGPASGFTAPRVHGRALTYQPPAAVVGHPRPRPPAQLPPSPLRKRRGTALLGDGAHRFRVLSAVSGSARLFPDQPGPRPEAGVGAGLPSLGRRFPNPRTRPRLPRLLSCLALFEDTSPSNPEVLSSKACWRLHVTLELPSSGAPAGLGRRRAKLLRFLPRPGAGPLLGPWPPFRWSLAHITKKCGPASLHLRPRGASLGTGLGWLLFSGRPSPHPHFDIQLVIASC